MEEIKTDYKRQTWLNFSKCANCAEAPSSLLRMTKEAETEVC